MNPWNFGFHIRRLFKADDPAQSVEKSTPPIPSIGYGFVTKGGMGSGNFGHAGRPGVVGGSGAGFPNLKGLSGKYMHQIIDAHKGGKGPTAIAKELGVGNKVVSHVLAKYKEAQKNLAAQLGTTSQAPAAAPAVAPPPVAATASSEPGLKSASGLTTWKKGGDGKWTPYVTSNGKVSPNPQAPPNGYEWAEKTTANSPNIKPENAGKYALFQNGVQVSPPYKEDQLTEAVNGLHYGAGPKDFTNQPSVVSSQATTTAAPKPPPSPPVKGKPGWQYSDTEARKMTEVKSAIDHYHQWTQSTDAQTKSEIYHYTGSGNGPMNEYLRGVEGVHENYANQADHLNEALHAAPKPPPPSMVWRGGDDKGDPSFVAKLSEGSIIRLDGVQSCSVNPHFAATWGKSYNPGYYTLEIKPKEGAYVEKLSSHQHENEFLIPHDGKYKVIGIVKGVNLGGEIRNVLQLRQL